MACEFPTASTFTCPLTTNSTEGILWLLDPWSRSWASVHHNPHIASEAYRVRQLGPRRLWDEIDRAYRWWVTLGEPTADQWKFTVTPHGQHVEIGPPG